MKNITERDLVGKQPNFRPAKASYNPYRILLLIALIFAGAWLLLSVERGDVRPLFMPTPTATRTANSYILEAQAYFATGKVDDPDPPKPTPPDPDAIDTYQHALEIDPGNAAAWAELARIQTYSITMLSNDADRRLRLAEALASINTAIRLNPDDSSNHAIRAFVLDWNASYAPAEQVDDLLKEAEGEAVRAYQLDPRNALALAFYAEVLLDQQKWTQADQYASQAIALNPGSMDAHRVYATVLESLGQYNSAIKEYLTASSTNPNLTFLYVYIGRNYLRLKLYDKALEYYAKAADIDAQLGVKNPIPNLEIAKVYTQVGEFFIAARNAEKALSYDPTNANTYGQLGIIMVKSRNYEGSMPVLKCVVLGCTAAENEIGGVDVRPLELSNTNVAYYYYTYGTVLAFLSRPTQNYCGEARQVLSQVRARFPDDATLTLLLDDSEGICQRLGNTETTPTPLLLPDLPELSPTPIPTVKP